MTHEVDDVAKRIPKDPFAQKIAKAIALLEVVKDLPRTARNLAAVLHPSAEADSVEPQTRAALKALETAQIVRETEEGYKLLTVQEKTWDTKRNEIAPKGGDRKRILQEIVKEAFDDPKVKTYRHKGLRNFKLAVSLDGEPVEADGQIRFNLLTAEDAEHWKERCAEGRTKSNEHRDEIQWVGALSDEIRDLQTEVHRSREMVSLHERLAAQGKLSPEETSCLATEKLRRDRFQRELRTRLVSALASGSGFFRGVQKDGSALGPDLAQVVQAMAAYAVPELYPKLELGARPLKGDEPERFLAAANLNGLPPLFYDGEGGLSLVVRQGEKLVSNASAEICKEVLGFVQREQAYGNRVTGKALEAHFQGIGYGWERDILRLVLAVLLRSGAVEVTHQGRKYWNHTDPACREPFTSNVAFRSASFAPRQALDLDLLHRAAHHYEEITGKEVDLEEGAIAHAFQALAAADRESLVPLVARMRALKLPGTAATEEHLQTVQGVLEMAADDCVRTLAGQGKSYKAARARTADLAAATTDENIEVVRWARRFVEIQWPVLRDRDDLPQLHDHPTPESAVDALACILEREDVLEVTDALLVPLTDLANAYAEVYRGVHHRRRQAYAAAVEALMKLPEWATLATDPSVPEEERRAILAPLVSRAGDDLDFPERAEACVHCRAGIPQMESDLAAVEGLKAQAVRRIRDLVYPTKEVEIVKVSSFLAGRIESAKDVEAAVDRLRDHLLKLIARGARIVLE